MSARLAILSLLLAAYAFAAGPALVDIEGRAHGSLGDGKRAASVLLFLLTDCPVSNRLAPEIGRICAEYAERGAGCFLVYADPDKTAEEVRAHAEAFGHGALPAILDRDRALTEAAGATITPEAAVYSAAGELVYRGRVNDLYASLGKPRPRPTEHDLRRALDEVLAGKPVTKPRTQAVGCFIPPKDL